VRRSPLALAYLRWIQRVARLDYVEGVHGHRMYLDAKDTCRISITREYEPAETRLVQRTVREGATVLDIGANIGYYTLLLARAVGPRGHVFAFEPDTTNFEILTRNVALNGYENVTLVNRAVWSSTTTLKLFLSAENPGDHRAYASGEARRFVEIPAVALDDYFGATPPRIDFIKMDIQGAEAHAIRGMMSLLRANPQARIASEFWPQGLAAAGSSAAEYLDTLRSLGYIFREIDDRTDALRPVDRDALLTEFAGGHRETNIFCERIPV
jgi:FkbM family methyltransferase